MSAENNAPNFIDAALAPLKEKVAEGIQSLGDSIIGAFDKLMTKAVNEGGLVNAAKAVGGAVNDMANKTISRGGQLIDSMKTAPKPQEYEKPHTGRQQMHGLEPGQTHKEPDLAAISSKLNQRLVQQGVNIDVSQYEAGFNGQLVSPTAVGSPEGRELAGVGGRGM